MMRTAELDMANTADPRDVADFLNDAAWAVRSTYHTVLKALQVQQFLVGTCCSMYHS